MRIELYQLAATGHSSYESLGSLDSDATPVKGTFVHYSQRFYIIEHVVISTNRIVAFVKPTAQQMGFERQF